MTTVWTIAGSDSGGGAGLQADLKTFLKLGAHGCSVVTAITAQNTFQVTQIHPTPPELFQVQLETLIKDLPPQVIKTGMLPTVEQIDLLASFLNAHPIPLICDPVLVATSGDELVDPILVKSLIDKLLPKTTLLTPNTEEASQFVGYEVDSPALIEKAASDLLKTGLKSVLIKGGHLVDDLAQDYWSDGTENFWLTSYRRLGVKAHGTGCTLASAITASLAEGLSVKDAIVKAKAYVTRAIHKSELHENKIALLAHKKWPVKAVHFPWLTKQACEAHKKFTFPTCGEERLGFYPVVDRLSWLEKLIPLGLKTAQLRIKDLSGEALENEIARSIQFASKFGCRLFVNDHWKLALKYNAYGIHLGQEDMDTTDLHQLHDSGTRLGLSTHSYSELSKALSLAPSYIALGPIFPTQSKPMNFAPQTIDRIREWRRLAPIPIVAIGGITLEVASEIYSAGADGIAVITDVTKAECPESRAKAWLVHAEVTAD